MSRALVLLISLLVTMPPHAAWAEDWSSQKKINLNTTESGADLKEDLSQVPVLVRLHTGNFAHFLDVKEDGSDLRFFDSDGKTPLPYHVEKFDSLNELALIWVQVPKLSAGKQDFVWMKYGNPQATNAQDAKAVYDANYVAVYHFGAPGAPKDQTGNANNASLSTAEHRPASIIGAGAGFSGAQKIVIPASPSLKFGETGFTFSAWVKIAAAQPDTVLFARQDGTDAVSLRIDNTRVYARIAHGGRTQETPHTSDLTLGIWHHLAMMGGARVTIYVDGRETATLDAATPALAGDITLGTSPAGSNSFSGELDEVQVSNIARSASWVKTTALGQGPEAKLVMLGGDEQVGGSTSYFGTILRAVTVDGWVVIALLAIMAGVSWWVMVNKFVTLRAVLQDNRNFMQAFQKLKHSARSSDRESDKSGEDDSPLFERSLYRAHATYQNSPIYQLYHIGVQEVRHRFGQTDTSSAQGKTLTPQALEAIRTGLDATFVRENQKLNNLLVLLTIAISGGPFLGLLGTVVGVMITFAAIAATGDVNINAIAPGIAAALVATVAGLLVAIPSLFGYNYIVSQIKDVTADMQVFIDEFVSRLAETYAGDEGVHYESAGRKRAL